MRECKEAVWRGRGCDEPFAERLRRLVMSAVDRARLAGLETLLVTDGQISSSLNALVEAAAPAHLIALGSGQSATISTAFGSPLEVQVTDAFSQTSFAAGTGVAYTIVASNAGPNCPLPSKRSTKAWLANCPA